MLSCWLTIQDWTFYVQCSFDANLNTISPEAILAPFQVFKFLYPHETPSGLIIMFKSKLYI